MSDALMTRWSAYQRAQALSERTITERTVTVGRLLRDTGAGLEHITADQVACWLGDLDVSAASRATYHGHLRAAFAWCQTVGLRTDNPMLMVPAPCRPRAVPRPIDTGQVPALLRAANRRRTRMMVLLAVFAGLRVHEIAKVRGEDVDLGASTLYVEGKGGTRSMLPLHHMIAAEAGAFPRRGWWFPSSAGGHIRAGSVSTVVGRTMRRAGIVGTAHQLRHWYGTTLLDAGADLRVVQELMRHESIQSTTIYTRVSDRQRREAIALLSA